MSNIKVNTIEANSGNSIVSNSYIKCGLPPIQSNDLVNKQYVDLSIASIPTTSTFYVDAQNELFATQAAARFVDKATNVSETILGTKTFSNTPKFGESATVTTPDDITNKTYVDAQDATILSQANAYIDLQVASVIGSTVAYVKVSVPDGVTGAGAFYTDPVAPFLTARNPNFVYANDSNYFTLEGRNGISITASYDDETFNRVQGDGVTSVTETVNRIIFDANSLGHVPQTWQDQLANRANNTNYVNTTGRPIMVIVKPNTMTSVVIQVGATASAKTTIYNNANSQEPPSFVVPVSGVYSVNFGSFPTSPGGSWMELS